MIRFKIQKNSGYAFFSFRFLLFRRGAFQTCQVWNALFIKARSLKVHRFREMLFHQSLNF